MTTFHIDIPQDPHNPDEQWVYVAAHIEAAFRACEGAELTLHRHPHQTVAMEVRLSAACDPVEMKLTLPSPPWHFEE